MRLKVLLYLMVFTLLVMATPIFAVVSSTTLTFEDQWMRSAHNFDPSTRSPAINASCVKCHDSDWFVKVQVNGEKPPAANLEKPAEYGHTCKTCHENENPTNILTLRKVGEVELPAHGDVIFAGVSASCMACHNGRRVNPEEYVKTSVRGTHEGPQADMLSGTGAITYGETFGSSAHTAVTTKGCVTCHMAPTPAEGERGHNELGEHTFKMYSDSGTPGNTKDDEENIGSCQKCHKSFTTFNVTAKGDYDGNGKVEGVQTEVKGLLALIAAELPKNVAGVITMPTNDDIAKMTPEDQVKAMAQRMANFNYALVSYDGSYGIHNTAYAVQVLRTTYEKLTGKTLAGDTIEAVELPAPVRPETSDAIDKRFKQWEVSPHNFDPVEREPSEEANCVRCHNSEWFVKIQVKGEKPPAENLPEPPSNGHTCATCHTTDDPTNMLRLQLSGDVTLPAYGDVVHAGVSATCMSCHNARRVNPEKYILTSNRGTHGGPQSDMLAGKSGISYGKTLESTSHFTAVEKKCVGCHMSDTPVKGKPGYNRVGDHTFRMVSDNGTPDDPKDDTENVATCQKCHTGVATFDFTAKDDYDGNGKVEGVQTEVKGLLALIAAELPKNPTTGAIAIPSGNIIPMGNASDIVPPLTPEEQDKLKAIRMANYNYTLVNNDGSYGVHNFRYAVDLLRTTYKQLTGKDVSVPSASDNVFMTSLTQGLNMISVPLKPTVAYTARSLANDLSATVVIKYDETLGKFVGFASDAPGDGFAIDGGKGYIVNVTKAGTVSFTGSAWTNSPPAAPPAVQSDNAWAFLVSGSVLDDDMISTGTEGYIVTVKNLRTGSVVNETLSNSGYFSAAWANLDRQAVIKAGDKVEISVADTSGSIVSGPFVYTIKLDQIKDTLLKVQFGLGDIVPQKSVLLQNYPNPFNPETWIPYYLKDSNSVSIKIFSSAGQLVRTLELGRKEVGAYVTRSKAAYWDGKNEAGEQVSSGIYFYNITAGDFSSTKKMLIKK